MRLVDVRDDERRALDAALRTTRRVREWRRLQAVRLLADGQEAPAVAQALGCSASSVYYWADDWREAGLAGLAEGPHDGRPRRLDGDAEATLTQVLTDDPHAYGSAATDWTVPLLRTALARRGHALSERTLRRALQRLGLRWKRPQYVLGRPDPAYEANKGR
jgi:transposase